MTAIRPKGLIVTGGGTSLVANKPLVHYGLDAMRSAGIRDVGILAPQPAAAGIRELLGDGIGSRLRLHYLTPPVHGGPVESLAAAEPFLGDSPCVVQLEDGLLRGELRIPLEELTEEGLDALLLIDVSHDDSNEPTGLEDERLLRMAGAARGLGRLAGAHVIGPGVVHKARSGGSLTKLLERLVAGGGRVRARPFEGAWRRVAEGDQLLEANRVVLDDLHPGPSMGELVDSRIQGRVSIGPGSLLESTFVRGPVVIGSGVQLRHAYVGPYTSIADGVEIEGAEVEHSVILPGAKISHVGGRLEASIVGRGAKVFRDFQLPRALRLRIADGDEIALA